MTVIYTAIFCLNNAENEQFGNFIELVLYGIIRVPFDDNDGQSFLSNCTCFSLTTTESNQNQ
jgi:hypothetical protein